MSEASVIGVGMKSCTCCGLHRFSLEVLHELDGVLERRARVGGDEVRDEVLLLPRLLRVAREVAAGTARSSSTPGFFISFSTGSQTCSGATLSCPETWCDDERLQVAVAVLLVGLGEVVADARADEEVLHALHLRAPSRRARRAGRGPPRRTGRRWGRRRRRGGRRRGPRRSCSAIRHMLAVAPPRSVMVPRKLAAATRASRSSRSTLASERRGDVAPLVLGDAAEGAARGAAAQDLDRPADLLQRRDVRAAVGRVGLARVGELARSRSSSSVLGGRHRLVHDARVRGRSPAPCRWTRTRAFSRVVLEVVEPARTRAKRPLVERDLLVGRELERPARRGPRGSPGRGPASSDRRPGHVDEAADVLAGGEPARDLEDRLLPLAVHERGRRRTATRIEGRTRSSQ